MENNERFLKIKEVMEISGLSRASIYVLGSAGAFPKPIKLGEKASGWLYSEIQAWMQSRIDLRGGRWVAQ